MILPVSLWAGTDPPSFLKPAMRWRQSSGHRGAVNVCPHSVHRIQSSASHVYRRIMVEGSVSALPQ